MSENTSRMEIMWGTAILDQGFTACPNIIVKNYTKMGINHGEFGFIMNLLTFKHDTRDPFPSEATLADSMGVHINQVKRWISSLKQKGFLLVGKRKETKSKKFANNAYSLKPLIDYALMFVGEKPLPDSSDSFEVDWGEKEKPQTQNVYMDTKKPQTQNVSTDSQQNVSTASTQNVSPKRQKEKTNKKDVNNNNKGGSNQVTEDESIKPVVVDVESIQYVSNALKENGLIASEKVISQWLSIENDKHVIESAIHEAIENPRIKNVIGYVKRMIENGYKPNNIIKRTSVKNDVPSYEIDRNTRVQNNDLGMVQKKQALELLFQLGELTESEYAAKIAELEKKYISQ